VGEASLQPIRYHCDARVLADALVTRMPPTALRGVAMLNAELRRLRLQCERPSLKSLAGELGVAHEALCRALAALEQSGRLAREEGPWCCSRAGVRHGMSVAG
jgi:hypothetical protein